MKIFERIFRKRTKSTPVPFFIEATERKDSEPCECCGEYTRRIRGFVHSEERAEAAYIVEWTRCKVAEHGANFDLIIGRWGEGAEATDRFAVSLEYRQTETGPWFTVIDASSREVSRSELVGKALPRSEVIGTPLAKRVFDMVDSVWCSDSRVEEIKQSAG
jgi:hypothetical protein